MNEEVITFDVSFEPFKGYTDEPLELIKDEKWTKLAQQVLNETLEKRINGISALKKMCQEAQIQLPFLTENKLSEDAKRDLEQKFWLMVLRAGGMDPVQAFKVFQNYLNILIHHPQYFAASKPPTKMDYIFQQQIHLMLQHRDQHGRRVYIYRPGKWNPDKVSFDDVFCCGYALSELVSLETKTQIAGVTTIADAEGFGFKQLRNFTIEHARNASSFIQDSFPLWFRSIHVINAPRLFYLAFNIVKPFLNERIKNSIFFHNSLESLHEHVPKAILPLEMGGEIGAFDNYECSQAVFGIEQHFNRVQQFIALNKSK